jgi:hypothetical protein
VCELPVAVENDFTTVLQLKRKFEKVCGARLTGEREVVHG